MTAKSAIETLELTRRFGRLTAVEHLNLQVPEGEVYGFLGPNGAGKTTTIRMLLGLIRPDGGKVRLFGRELKTARRHLLKRIGALVESPSVYAHLTGRENLETTRRLLGLDRTRVDRALDTVNLTRNSHRKVSQYSTGMRQRMGVAQALLAEPELIILDEPTNGLDPAGIQEVRELIRELPRKNGVTVFLSSHLLHEVEQVADRIGIIQSGQLRFEGPLKDLQSRRRRMVKVGVDLPDKAGRILHEAGIEVHSMDDRMLTLSAEDENEAAGINSRLVAGGCRVFHLNLVLPKLEEIFLNLTADDQGGEGNDVF